MSDLKSESAPGGGARLHWWQESSKTPSSQPWYRSAPSVVKMLPAVEETIVTAPVTVVAPAPLDIGEELEAEALRRAHAEAIGARVVVPYDRVKYVANARKRFYRAAIPQVLAMLLQISSAIALHSLFPLLAVIFIAMMIFMMWKSIVMFTPPTQGPVLVMTDEGLEIAAVGTIFWHEIAEIKRHQIARHPVVAIVPRDSTALAERLKTTATGADLTKRARRKIHRRFGAGVANAGHNQTLYMVNHFGAGISTDEMLAKINAFRRARGV